MLVNGFPTSVSAFSHLLYQSVLTIIYSGRNSQDHFNLDTTQRSRHRKWMDLTTRSISSLFRLRREPRSSRKRLARLSRYRQSYREVYERVERDGSEEWRSERNGHGPRSRLRGNSWFDHGSDNEKVRSSLHQVVSNTDA